MRQFLKHIVEESDTRTGRAFDLVIQGLILLSLITFSIETLPNLSATARRWLHAVEVFTVAVFTVEYALRIFVADRPLRYIFSALGLIDLLAILPFYFAPNVDLRSARAIRFFRVFRIFRISRYTRAIRRIKAAFLEVQEELILFLFATLLTLYLVSVGIYYFEAEAQPEHFGSVFQCMWWAIITLSTVGYGDAIPITPGGRIFTGLVLVLGLGLIAVPTGLLASALTKTHEPR